MDAKERRKRLGVSGAGAASGCHRAETRREPAQPRRRLRPTAAPPRPLQRAATARRRSATAETRVPHRRRAASPATNRGGRRYPTARCTETGGAMTGPDRRNNRRTATPATTPRRIGPLAPGTVVAEEAPHRPQTPPAQFLDRRHVSPHEVVPVTAHLVHHDLECLLHAALDLPRRRGVQRIDGDHASVLRRQLGIEAGRPVTAADDAPAQIRIRQCEHPPVLRQRAAPRHDPIDRKRQRMTPSLSARQR